jgi:hypothetical protein
MQVAGVGIKTSTRLGAWLFEMLCVVVLMGPATILIFGRSNDVGLAFDLVRVQVLTATFILVSGYWVTTAVLAAVLGRHWVWFYPVGSAALWVAHVQLAFAGTKRPTESALQIEVLGAAVVFLCSAVGSWVALRLEHLRAG